MDRIESSGLKFFNDVRNGYIELADKYPRIKCIDAEKDTYAISMEIINLDKILYYNIYKGRNNIGIKHAFNPKILKNKSG